jgi:hypothetical protein
VSTTVIIVIAVAAIIALVLMSGIGGGPRVTTIERKTEERDEDRDA